MYRNATHGVTVCVSQCYCIIRLTYCKLLLTRENNNGGHAGGILPDPWALQLMGTVQANSCYACWALERLPSNDHQPLVCQVAHGNGIAVGQLVPEGKVTVLKIKLQYCEMLCVTLSTHR